MPVIDLCARSPVCIERTAHLSEAARLMRRHHVGAIIVVDTLDSKRPIGVLTDRDIALSLSGDAFPAKANVEDLMSKKILTASADKGIASIIDMMEGEGARRLVVLDNAGRACGLISSDDIIQLLAREMNGLGKLVQKQIQNEKIYGPDNQVLMT